MTAKNCMYWQGEGCICEIETGVKCPMATDNLAPQCNATDKDLEDIEDDETK